MTPRSPNTENVTSGATNHSCSRAKAREGYSWRAEWPADSRRFSSPPRQRGTKSMRMPSARATERTASMDRLPISPRSMRETVLRDSPLLCATSSCRSRRRIRTARIAPPSRIGSTGPWLEMTLTRASACHYRAWLYGERALEVQEESLAILTSTVPSDSSGCGHDAMAGNHDRDGVDVQRISRGARCPRGPRGGRHFPVGGHVTERNMRRGLQHPNGEAMNE